MTLDITLDTSAQDPLFQQIATRVRSAIIAGQLAPGARLPSSRALATQLAIARGTVDAAYALLANEGAIETRRPGGTIVSGPAGSRVDVAEQAPLAFPAGSSGERTGSLPFQVGLPALDAFPRKLWYSTTARAARSIEPADLAPSGAAGDPGLRQQVAAYLASARGIICSSEQVLITAGYQGALALVRAVLVRPGDPVWIEDPGYLPLRLALEAAGARVVPVRVDAEGLRVGAGISAAPKAKLAVVTPCHHFPAGAALSLPRRLALLAWAADAGSWIMEDDYDSEFRYAGRPLRSLKSIDRANRVIHAGSFSKLLFPALRLGYLVVPEDLHAAFLRASRLLTAGLPTLEQRTVAAFMRGGDLRRHTRKMRRLYGERRNTLTAALRDAFGDSVAIEPDAGGLHLLARFPGAGDDSVLAKRAGQAGLAPAALSPLTMAHDAGQGLLLGFANLPVAEAGAAVARLAEVVRSPL